MKMGIIIECGKEKCFECQFYDFIGLNESHCHLFDKYIKDENRLPECIRMQNYLFGKKLKEARHD